jgi:hypothetical protein
MNRTLLILAVSSPLLSFPLATASDVAVTVSETTMTPMKSPWADYLGTHYASTPDEAGKTWNTVRSYGGTRVGIQSEGGSLGSERT